MTRKIKHFISYTILIIASLLSVFPLYYMLSGATNKSIDIVRGRLIPGGYLVENFRTLVANQNLGLAMFNSFRNAILITIISLLVCSIADEYSASVYDAPICSTDDSAVQDVLYYGIGKQLDCTGVAVNFHAVYDHAVPAGIKIFPYRHY